MRSTSLSLGISSLSCWEEDSALRKWSLPRYCCVNCILETKTIVGSTTVKAPAPCTNPNIDEASTTPKSHTHPSHECDGHGRDPESTTSPPTPKSTRKTDTLVRASHHVTKKTLRWGSCILHLWIKKARAKDKTYIMTIHECRCDERLKIKDEKSTRLVYTGLIGELEHLKIKTRLIDEMFASVMGEYVFLKW
jgi:hypothetical protein